MEIRRRTVFQGAGAAALAAFGVAEGSVGTAFADSSPSNGAYSLQFDSTAWSYDAANDVYYQIGNVYAANPEAPDYENLSIYVPGAYLTATLNSDGSTYTARVNPKGRFGRYSAHTAPIVSPAFGGYRQSKVSPHWRIHTGIMQGDTANTTEINLLLALQNYGVRDIQFATVWAQAHTTAETTGDSTSTANFISWVESIVKK
ncbi:hypothetical protein [Actinospica robiniae]|uniref:hypothetical protein n=1 Tax=Actinospica robiniae TaxID=304901 RepID=UPI00042542EA|nr:hypothetical protein [Actinospica robiniae]